MSRVVNGNSFTENGWPLAAEDETNWVTIPGTGVSLQLQKGQPTAIMRAFAADFNAYVEPLRDADSAAFTISNDVLGQPGKNNGSNHLGATAQDLNWNSHAFHVRGTFNVTQMATIREMQEFYKQDGLYMMFWGGDWTDPIDEMHWQMGYNTYGDPRVAAFIARNIRADGFSTFRRGNAPVTAAPILAKATGLSEARATQIIDEVRGGLVSSQCTTTARIAMWLAQIGHESDGFNATEEYDKGDGGLTERWRYLGRTWIQITWKSNYAGFSQWCYDRALVPTPTYFVDQPAELADLKWAGLGPAWYWTVERPQINTLCDAGNLDGVTRAINGGTNGIDDRRYRYNLALTMGDSLLQLLTQEDDDMFTDNDRDLLRQVAEIRRPSLSPLRHLGEGAVNTCAGFAWSADGLTHPQFVAMAARVGHLDSIKLLAEVAGADPGKYPDRQSDAALARAILADIEATNPAALQQFITQNGARS